MAREHPPPRAPLSPWRGSSSRPVWADKALPSLGEGWEDLEAQADQPPIQVLMSPSREKWVREGRPSLYQPTWLAELCHTPKAGP